MIAGPGQSPNLPPSDEDDLLTALVRIDEELRAGNPLSTGAGVDDPTADEELAAAQACLSLLERAFPRMANAVPEPQARIGRFELLHVLGQGGFGIVYLAYDPKLNRHVALKVPRLHALADEPSQQRFLREARAGAALDHPNIVPVLETGTHGVVEYIVTPYCEGPNLAAWMRDAGPAAPRLAARLVAVLAGAMEASHRSGVLHRDLKPTNILLTSVRDTSECPGHFPSELLFVPRITDFGLAKLKEETANETGSAVLGTLLYMAPEQALSQTDRIGPATDVYSLGVILYELLTGRPPIDARTLLEVLNELRSGARVPPSRLQSEVPRDLDTICLKCLEVEPAQRYQTAAALEADLQAFLEGRPIAARPPSPAERMAKWVRRHPWAAGLIGVIAVASALIAGQQWRHHEQSASSQSMTQGLKQEVDLQHRARRLKEQAGAINSAGLNLFGGDAQIAAERLAPFDNSEDRELRAASGMDWAWQYVDRQLRAPQMVSEMRHATTVYSVAISPDGRIVASGDGKGLIKIWELATGREITTLAAHDGEVRALEFSPSGDRLASGGQFHWLRLWDTANWGLQSEFNAHDGTITCLVWHPKGTMIYSGGRDGYIRSWQARGGLQYYREIARGDVINQLQMTADGSTLYSSDKSRRIAAWDLKGEVATSIELFIEASNPLGLAVSADGDFGLSDGRTFFSPQGPRFTLHHGYGAKAIVIGPDQTWGAIARNEVVHLLHWDRTPLDGYSIQEWRAHGDTNYDVTASTDGQFLATASADGSARIWRVADLHEPTRCWFNLTGVDSPSDVAFSPDGQWLAVSTTNGTLSLYSTRLRKLVHRLDLRRERFKFIQLGFAADNRTVLVRAQRGDQDRGLLVWNSAQPEEYRLISTPPLVDFAVSADGRRMVSMSEEPDRQVTIWDTHSLQPEPLATGDERTTGVVQLVQLSPDGRTVAYEWREGAVVVDLVSGRRTVLTIEYPLQALALNTDGTKFCSVDGTGNFYLYDVASGRRTARHRVSELWTYRRSIHMSPDERFVAVSSTPISGVPDTVAENGEVIIWNLETEQPVLTLKPFHLAAGRIRWSRDGRMLAAVTSPADRDGQSGVFLWYLKSHD